MFRIFKSLDWVLLFSATALIFLGLITMKSFGGSISTGINGDYYFYRQLIWFAIAIVVFFITSWVDWNFLKTNSIFLLLFYLFILSLLFVLAIKGHAVRGAASWFTFASVKIEPVEVMKLALILLLSKYFSRRHVEIARFRTLFISGFYVAIPMGLVMLQPDLGSAIVLGVIWFGMALVAKINLKHLFLLFLVALLGISFAWSFVLYPYQKARVISFINPESDAKGRGYHALQSMIAIGSGEILGKGIGYGTQSRLEFLPEHETDFIFAAFAEEWGFFGVGIVFLFYGIILWRILRSGVYSESNFEKLYAAGFAILLFFQTSIHIGMNAGILPITGLGMPFLSYGGSNMVSMFFGLGVLQSFVFHKKAIFMGSEERFKEGILAS